METVKSIIAVISPYKKIILIALLCLIALFALWFLLDWFSGYLDKREIESDKKAINGLQQDANDIKANLSNLRINEAVRETETNVARNNYVNALGMTNEARAETNRALENINAIELSNYADKTLQDAQEARCRAFPDRAECQK